MAAKGVPDPERLARHTEEWLNLLTEALPPLRSGPPADAPAPAAPPAPVMPSQPPARSAGEGSPGERSQAHEGSPAVRGSVAEEASAFLTQSLERLFGNPQGQQDEAGELPPGSSTFRVQVPKQYPGVQYRKSKNLNDRYPRYAKLGTVVAGQVEDNGEWLRINDQVFLPMKVGGLQILEPSPTDTLSSPKVESGRTVRSLWFACSQGTHGEEQEVVTDFTGAN